MTYLSPVHWLDLFLVALLTAHSPLANIQGFIFMVCQLPPATPCPHPHSGALDGPLPEVGLFIPSSSTNPGPAFRMNPSPSWKPCPLSGEG